MKNWIKFLILGIVFSLGIIGLRSSIIWGNLIEKTKIEMETAYNSCDEFTGINKIECQRDILNIYEKSLIKYDRFQTQGLYGFFIFTSIGIILSIFFFRKKKILI